MKRRILQEILNESLGKHKHNIAIEWGSRVMSYNELEIDTNHIANWLIKKGIAPQTYIGILIDDKVQFILAMVGILKAGCVFVPLDPGLPRDRLEMMIKEVNIPVIIRDSHNHRWIDRGIENQASEGICIDDIFSNPADLRYHDKPAVRYHPEDKIYVYFTSGTTGTPCAILGKNKSLLHFIEWEIQTFAIDETFRFAQFTNCMFDAILRDIFVPLCSGGTICVPDMKDIISDPGKLSDWLEKSGIHLIHFVPALFRVLNSNPLTRDRLKNLKFILLSGERINPTDLVKWYNTFDERIQLVNLWGTSETTLAKTCYFIRKIDINREKIPIGKPIKGAMVVVLDDAMKICSEQVIGDLYIRTPFRTIGYLNSPQLNQERFIRNPFNDNPDDLLHKTGDLGRILLDGNLELLGRNDRQVKVQGIRVELEEIENVLIKHPLVEEAIVIKKELPGNNELLCAYVTAKEKFTSAGTGKSFTTELKEYASGKLPAYMVPGHIIKIEAVPRNPNGKVDYQRLPDPMDRGKAGYLPPGNDVEKRLQGIWSAIFAADTIGITDNFFELGGNSLNLMTLIAKIHREFSVRIPLGEIFNNPTIARQAKIIIESEKEKYTSIEAIEKREYYDISYAQGRVWLLSQLQEASLAFNMPLAYVLTGQLHRQAFNNAFVTLVKRHESLRTVFRSLAGKVYQQVLSSDEINFKLNYIDLRECQKEEKEQKVVDLYARESNTRFDLAKGPLLRATLVQMEEERYVFLFTQHHIVSDLLSNKIVAADVFTLYHTFEKGEGNPLPPLRIHYKDFSAWQNKQLTGEYLNKHRHYWLKRFEKKVPPLELPLDKKRPGFQTYNGDFENFPLDETLTAKLKSLSERYGATLFMILLASVNVLLYHYTAREDIVIGIPIAGRQHAELEDQIGFYLNTLALRTTFDAEEPFSALVKKAKKVAADAFEHQDYPFDKLVEDLGGKRDISRHPLFDVVIDMQNYTQPKGDLIRFQGDLSIYPYMAGMKTSKFDLALYVQESKRSININFEYNTDIFLPETIRCMIERFKRLLEYIVKDPDTIISDFRLEDELEIPTIAPLQKRAAVE
jgi:amino acid adenylation domain-containing protein